jgi:uncharacterized membrane protein
MSAMPHQPDGAAFDMVLLLHVGCAVVGLVTTVTAAATAIRLRRLLGSPVPLPDPLRRYFRPGFNWAGRTIYGIPVFGFVLLAMSHGAYSLGQGWVLAGLGLFAGVALVGEGAMWPAEQRLQRTVTAGDPATGTLPATGVMNRDATVMTRAAGAALVLMLAWMIVMVAQP